MHWPTLPDLQAAKTCQTKHRKDNQRANTGVFNFAPTFSGEKQVCLSIVRLLKLPERQIANIYPLATSTEALCCCLSFISVAGTNFQFVIL